jgi:hypothetical protein
MDIVKVLDEYVDMLEDSFITINKDIVFRCRAKVPGSAVYYYHLGDYARCGSSFSNDRQITELLKKKDITMSLSEIKSNIKNQITRQILEKS